MTAAPATNVRTDYQQKRASNQGVDCRLIYYTVAMQALYKTIRCCDIPIPTEIRPVQFHNMLHTRIGL